MKIELSQISLAHLLENLSRLNRKHIKLKKIKIVRYRQYITTMKHFFYWSSLYVKLLLYGLVD